MVKPHYPFVGRKLKTFWVQKRRERTKTKRRKKKERKYQSPKREDEQKHLGR